MKRPLKAAFVVTMSVLGVAGCQEKTPPEEIHMNPPPQPERPQLPTNPPVLPQPDAKPPAQAETVQANPEPKPEPVKPPPTMTTVLRAALAGRPASARRCASRRNALSS